MNNIIESLNWRYATKKFDATKKISSEKLETLKHAFNLTATSYGLQALTMVVVENNEKREALVEHAFNQRQVADASHLLVICHPENFDGEDVKKYFNLVKEIRNTPEEVLQGFQDFLVNEFNTKSTDAKHESFRKQAYIALGNLMTVCALEQIDSCPMEGFIPAKFDEQLGLKEKGLKSVVLLPVGYRAEDDFMSKEKKVRKPISESVIEL